MSSLAAYEFDPVYDANSGIKEFYNTALASAKVYKRVSAYFDPKLFYHISKGVKQLLLNNGNMKLILSTEIKNKNLIDEITSGYKAREEFTSYKLDMTKLLENNQDFASLAFLIKIGKLDIKIAKTQKGIFHEKYGLISDSEGHTILFSGSNNETQAALQYNFESFETTMSWSASKHELSKIEHRQKAFQMLWSNTNPKTEVWDAPTFFNLFNIENSNDLDEKIATNIKEPMLLLDYDYSSNRLTLKSYNLSIEAFFNNASSNKYLRLADTNGNVMKFHSNLKNKDIDEIFKFIHAKTINSEYNLITTNDFERYRKSCILDMDQMSRDGQRIKSQKFYDTDEFNEFYQKVNSILNRPLRKAQSMTAYHLIQLKRTMNFSVPGSGKTASVLGAFLYLKNHLNALDKLFVVGPVNSFKAWKEEYKILMPEASKYDIFDFGEEKDIGARIEILKSDFSKLSVILVNYEAVPKVDNILSRFIDDNVMIVFDEIHRIKRIDGKQFNATYKIAQKAAYRTALTGTPLPNGYKDLHNLFRVLYDDYSYTYFNFDQSYLNEIQKRFDNMSIEDKELNDLIAPFFVRVSKRDLEVPPANADKIYKIQPTPNEDKIYSDIFNDSSRTLFSKMISLTQVGLQADEAKRIYDKDESNFFEGEVDFSHEMRYQNELTSKSQALLKIVKKLLRENKSVVIWAVFIKSINTLETILTRNGIDVKTIYGNTPTKERDELINEFNQKRLDVLLTNPSTLAESVSLHKGCHDAIYVELNFNLAQYLQSRDRIHRLGLSESVETNYHIILNDYKEHSIDMKIYDKLKEKEQLMYSAIEENKLFTKKDVSVEEIEPFFNKGS